MKERNQFAKSSLARSGRTEHSKQNTECTICDRKCKPSDSSLMSLLHPLQTEDNTCVIQLTDVTDLVSGTWEGESGFFEKEIDLTIHENVTGLEVVVSDDGGVVSGQDTLVTCTVQGGRPTPEVVFMLMEGVEEVEVG